MTLNNRSETAIVIPTFNEDRTLKKIIKKASQFGDVIIVDDNSSDQSYEISKKYASYVKSHKQNLGYDNSLETGIKIALRKNYKYLVTVDADGEHPIEEIPEFISKLKSKYQLVIGNRDKKNRYTETIFSYYTKSRWNIKDPLCGMKAYRISSIRKISTFNSYNSIGTELAFKIAGTGVNLCNINIKVNKRFDDSRIGNSLGVNISILKSLFRSFKI